MKTNDFSLFTIIDTLKKKNEEVNFIEIDKKEKELTKKVKSRPYLLPLSIIYKLFLQGLFLFNKGDAILCYAEKK